MRRMPERAVEKNREFIALAVRTSRSQPGVGPFLTGLIHGDSQSCGNLVVTQAGEISQLRRLSAACSSSAPSCQRFVECQQRSSSASFEQHTSRSRVDAGTFAAVSTRFFRRVLLDKDPPHRFGGRGKEVAAAVPVLRLLDVDQPQIRLMHERRRLKRLARLLLRQFARCQFAQLVVHQRQQLLRPPPGRLALFPPGCGSRPPWPQIYRAAERFAKDSQRGTGYQR